MPEASQNPADMPQQPEVKLWAQYPSGRYQAAIQSDGRCLYFVVQSDEEPQPRICWVRNLVDAPMVFPSTQHQETPPLLPESYCRHPKGLPEPDWDNCRIYWFPQGLGAAFFEGDQLLALIPPLPDQGLPGFAVDCLHPCPVALPLDDEDCYLPQTHLLASYWNLWASAPIFQQWHDVVQKAFQPIASDHAQFYANPQSSWPPVGVQRWDGPQQTILTTVGMGLRAQIGVEKEIQNFQDHQQMELAICIPAGEKWTPEHLLQGVQWLAGLSRYPWHYQTHFLPGHTVSPPPELANAVQQEAISLINEAEMASRHNRPEIQLPDFASQPVNLLWLDI